MTFSSALHGTTNSISSRKTSRRVFFLLPAYSASAKLIWPIASTPLPDSTSHGVIGGLVQTFLSPWRHRATAIGLPSFQVECGQSFRHRHVLQGCVDRHAVPVLRIVL